MLIGKAFQNTFMTILHFFITFMTTMPFKPFSCLPIREETYLSSCRGIFDSVLVEVF